MIWTCEKCGKKMEISPEQLEETGGVVVCPQCLSTSTVDGVPPRRKPSPRPKPAPVAVDTPVKQAPEPRSQRVISFEEPATPPPRRRKAAATPPPRPATPPPPRRRPKPSPDMKKNTDEETQGKGLLHAITNPPGALGCLWRSVVATAILLLVYVVFGLIFSL